MTTEIAILNKSAVALAADSAVTISTSEPGGGSRVHKIYVDANKLFEMIKGRPVGVMIYSSAEIAGFPWETLIKVFRARQPHASFDTLSEYVEAFLGFVANEVPAQMGPDSQRQQVYAMALPLAAELYAVMLQPRMTKTARIDRRGQFEKALTDLEQQIDSMPLLPWAAGMDEAALWREWGGELTEVLPLRTEEVTLTRPLRRRFAQTVLRTLPRLENVYGTWSGLVIAGFGESELFPSVYHARIGGFLAGRLIKVGPSLESITHDRPAIIEPYAQTGEANMFLRGIDPEVSRAVSSFWGKWAAGVHEDVAQIVKTEARVSPTHLESIKDSVKAYMDSSWATFSEYMEKEFHSRRMKPIEASASFLSKREIAELAENLVDLTSLRNRVSLDRQETVGGDTDVAVISRGDGFVWVKRKHYFERDRNPAWGMRQALTDVVSRVQAQMGAIDDGRSHDSDAT